MEAFHWSQQFETGLSEVDQQHHQLVNIINTLGNELMEDQLCPESIENILHELLCYTEYHFREEEQRMLDTGIDERHLKVHIETHHDFIREVLAIYESIAADNVREVKHLLDFLIHWLMYHILGLDQNMARQTRAIASGISPSQAYEDAKAANDTTTETLIHALQGLFQLVSERNKALVELNKSLEAKVKERTQDLLVANQHLAELASTDVLTGLPNRRQALCHLSDLWQTSIRHNQPLTCIMIDADHFKEVNDTCGHDAGDTVLRTLARTLRDNFRNDDVVCRLGGDEFLVLCPDTDLTGAHYVAEFVRQTVAHLDVSVGAGSWHGSVSVGLAARTPAMKTYKDLIMAADDGVYAAKQAGKNCVRTAKPAQAL